MDIYLIAQQIGGNFSPSDTHMEFDIFEAALGDPKQNEWADGTLYFFFQEQLTGMQTFPACILLSGDLPKEYAGQFHCVSVQPESAIAAFNQATRLLKAESSRSKVEALYEFADTTRQLDEVIDRAATELDASLIAFDTNFFLWSYSRSVPVIDPVWKSVVADGYGSYSFVAEVKKLFEHEKADYVVQEVTCDQPPYRKFRRHLFHGDRWIGTILMICSRTPADTAKLKLFEEVSGAIYYTIQNYARHLLREDVAYTQLLYHLLIGASVEDIRPQINAMQFPERMSVLVVKPDHNMGENWIGSELIPAIFKIDPSAKITYSKEGLAVLVSMDIIWETMQQRITGFRVLANEKKLRIGSSIPFQSIASFRRYYDMACEALAMAEIYNPDSRLNLYLDYQFFSLLRCIREDVDLHTFAHPALSILRQYDRENRTELYLTLKVFVEQGCRPGQTAEALFIHRNTLTKRMERVHEVCLLDLEDPNTIFSLSLSFEIERYLLQGM